MSHVAVIVAPDPVVDIGDGRMHLRVDDGAEDVLIKAFIAAATATLDGPTGWLGRALGRQTLELRRNGFPCGDGWVSLPYIPIASIVSVSYDDPAGLPQLIDPSGYRLYGSALALGTGLSWPASANNPESVRIRYLAGYESGALPAPIRAAILLMLGDLYRHRETTTAGSSAAVPMSTTVENLLSTFRVWGC